MIVLKKAEKRRPASPLRRLSGQDWAAMAPTWRDAKVGIIDAALARARARPSGNWFVAGASRDVRTGSPVGTTVGDVELVLWRTPEGTVHAGPGACPHLGADMSTAVQSGCELICRWHGLALGPSGRAGWRTLPTHDDGVLVWVRLDAVGGEEPTEAPVVPVRPPQARSLVAVATVVGTCEPDDVIANRLDPWHGAWLHPYSFAALRVLSAPPIDCPPAEDRFLVEVTFTIGKRFGVPVRAEFSCPEPRTVTMEIVDGEGAGSVVATHATPLRPDAAGRARTAVIEAVVAHSDRPGFAVARSVACALRPLMARTAARLWRDDIAYAERLHSLRTQPRT
jgi:nitrite reductase/ring-hydroxylating ferredoxin subunit